MSERSDQIMVGGGRRPADCRDRIFAFVNVFCNDRPQSGSDGFFEHFETSGVQDIEIPCVDHFWRMHCEMGLNGLLGWERHCPRQTFEAGTKPPQVETLAAESAGET